MFVKLPNDCYLNANYVQRFYIATSQRDPEMWAIYAVVPGVVGAQELDELHDTKTKADDEIKKLVV